MRPAAFLAAALAFCLASCISVRESEDRTLTSRALAEKRFKQVYRAEDVGPLQVRSIVYRPAIVPLADFLSKLAHGDYRASFKAVHLLYSPSNVNDEAVRLLVKAGSIPVLVEVANGGPAPADLSRLSLRLADGTRSSVPVPNAELPRVFEELNPKALAANVYNTGAVVVGSLAFAAAVAGTVLAEMTGSSGFAVPYVFGDMLDAFDGDVYNAARKTTTIRYESLLWSNPVVAPGEKARGLLFFRVDGSDRGALLLKADFAS